MLDSVIGIVALIVTVGGSIIGHICFSIWWASRINTTLDFLQKTVTSIAVELKAHQNGSYSKEEAAKEQQRNESQHKALWEKMDDARLRLDHIEIELAKRMP